MDDWILLLILVFAAIFLFSLGTLIASAGKRGKGKTAPTMPPPLKAARGFAAEERKPNPDTRKDPSRGGAEKTDRVKVLFENRPADRGVLCRSCECENPAGARACEACGEPL